MRELSKRLIRESAEEEAQINLTPLIDVVFVVLIMFILIAPILELDRISLAHGLQTDDKILPVVSSNSSITIHVRADNSIWLNSKQISEAQLIEALKRIRRLHPAQIPQLYHDRKAAFGTYQSIKNAAEAAGFGELDVILEPG